MLHLGVELVVDRQANTEVSMSVFQFQIEDLQEGISQPFRVSYLFTSECR